MKRAFAFLLVMALLLCMLPAQAAKYDPPGVYDIRIRSRSSHGEEHRKHRNDHGKHQQNTQKTFHHKTSFGHFVHNVTIAHFKTYCKHKHTFL